jgi:hypothetical protein
MSYGSARDDSGGELGSLAQSARRTSLRQARIILIIIGALNLLLGVGVFLMAEGIVRQSIEAEKRKAGPNVVFDPAEVKKVEEHQLQVVRLVAGGEALLGLIFIGLGMAVYRAPVACTVTGLVLFVGLHATAAAIDPVSIVQGILFKIIFLICLIKAVQAALAYEREMKAERAARRDEFESGMSEEPYAN